MFNRVGKRETFTPEQRRERARNGMRAHVASCSTPPASRRCTTPARSPDQILAYEDCRTQRRADAPRLHDDPRRRRRSDGLKAANIYTGFGDEWIRVGGVKFVADGSASERTMRMSTPYVGTNDYGILTMTQEQLYEAVDDAHSHNFQVGVHANGDVTIDMVLKAYERALQKWPRPEPAPPHRALHARQPGSDPRASRRAA